MSREKVLTQDQINRLLEVLRARFESNKKRHKDIAWTSIQSLLENNPDKLWALNEMESSGGEPDVVGYDESTGEYLFVDCSPESPGGRRNLCYDREALESRKQNKPSGSAVDMVASIGIELLEEDQYRQLQQLGEFDLKTSSWIKTPDEVRARGGALFFDRRYDRVFTYHNGAESYYAARGFRGILRV